MFAHNRPNVLCILSPYRDTSLQALRLCLLGSAGRASLQALDTVLTALTPTMYLIGDSKASAVSSDYLIAEDEGDYEDDDLTQPGLGFAGKPLNFAVRINPDEIRNVSPTSTGCSMHATQFALLNKQPRLETEDPTFLQLARALERLLLPRTVEEAHNHWTFSQSRAIALMLAIKHTLDSLIDKQVISTGIIARLEGLIIQLTSNNQSAVSQLGYRCIVYFIGHVAENPAIQYDLCGLMQQLSKGFRSDVIDIRLLITVIANHIAWRASLSTDTPTVPDWISSFIAQMPLGT